jgi:hypothetical protein
MWRVAGQMRLDSRAGAKSVEIAAGLLRNRPRSTADAQKSGEMAGASYGCDCPA